jgi:superfamily II DNA or RNA helicase
MSNYINKKGYVIYKKNLTEDEIKDIKEELTVKPFVPKDYAVKNQDTSFSVYLENKKKIYIPKYYGIQKFGKNYINKLPESYNIDLDFSGSLREYQLEPIKIILESLEKGNSGIVEAKCGFGKTTVSCYLISKLKKKTLVIVHKEFLLNQWKERIQQFLPEANIGIIQQNKIEIEGKDIVIAMLQSISMKDYAENTFDTFGLVIIDECHRVPCNVFSQALKKINSEYILGLSATPKRLDKLDQVLKWYIGDVIYKYIKTNDVHINVNVDKYSLFSTESSYNQVLLNYNQKANMPVMINNICNYNKRSNIIINIIKDLILENRNILLLSDRRNHLDYLYNIIKNNNICTVGYYVGGMKQSALKESENKQIILGTFSMAAEGMDIPSLNTLILASPKSNIEQSVGRILRKKHDNIDPKIIDIVDTFSIFLRQSMKRTQFYSKNKYTINNFNIDDDFKTI